MRCLILTQRELGWMSPCKQIRNAVPNFHCRICKPKKQSNCLTTYFRYFFERNCEIGSSKEAFRDLVQRIYRWVPELQCPYPSQKPTPCKYKVQMPELRQKLQLDQKLVLTYYFCLMGARHPCRPTQEHRVHRLRADSQRCLTEFYRTSCTCLLTCVQNPHCLHPATTFLNGQAHGTTIRHIVDQRTYVFGRSKNLGCT